MPGRDDPTPTPSPTQGGETAPGVAPGPRTEGTRRPEGRSPRSESGRGWGWGRLRALVWPAVGLALGAATLWGVDLTATGRALAGADPAFLCLALVSVGVTLLAKTLRWRLLFDPTAHPAPPLRRLAAALLVGQMANTLLPARLGEPARALLAGRGGTAVRTAPDWGQPAGTVGTGVQGHPVRGDAGPAYVLGTIVVEKVVDTLLAALLLVLVVPFFSLPPWLWQPGIALIAVALLLLALNLLLAWQRHRAVTWVLVAARWLPGGLRERIERQVASGLEGLASLLRVGAGPGLWAWSVTAWAAAVLTNHLILLALGVELPLVASALLLLVLQAGVSIPASFGRLGAFLYLASLGLSLFAVDRGVALSFGLTLFVIVYVPPVLLGVVLAWALGIDWQGRERGERNATTGSGLL